MMTTVTDGVATDGFAVAPGLVDPAAIAALLAALAVADTVDGALARGGSLEWDA